MDTASLLNEQSKKLIDEGKYAEAFLILKKAVQETANDWNLWANLARTALQLEQFDDAIKAYKQIIRIEPQSDWAWRQLAKALLDADRLDEVEKILDNAKNLNANNPWLWRHFAKLHSKRNNFSREIEALEMVNLFGEANSYDLNMLGIAYHNHGNYAKAIEYYRLSAIMSPDAAPFFNLGLVFNDREVSQDVDAADAYCHALALNPDHQRAKKQLDIIQQKLIPLAERAKTASKDLIQQSEYFQFYLSPFEALQIEPDESADVIDVKAVQRAKKYLLQEIDLNDGKVSWLGDYFLSKSRALTMEDELFDDHKRRYHLAIFQNQRLLRFLTRGDIDHFLYANDYFPKETIELLENEPGFCNFLSKPFALQYNFILSRALELQLLPVVEVLFDGRRWVLPENDDMCFEGANKQINYLVNLLQIEVSKGEKEKPNLLLLESLLYRHKFLDIFNLLPAPFRSAQTSVITKLRSLAISCYNNHGDANLSQAVLNLCKRFQFKSIELNKKLEEDYKAIAEMIAEERKYEAKFVFGKDRSFEITKDGIRDGNSFLPVSSINKMRWGITIIGFPGGEKYDYLFVVTNDAGETIKVSWCVYNEDEHVANSTKHFNSIVQAALNYLAGTVIEKIKLVLLNGQSVVIGSCTLTKGGIEFKYQGLLFKKSQFINWLEISTEIKDGQVIVYKTSQRNIATAMSAREVDNAVLLPIITVIMQNKNH